MSIAISFDFLKEIASDSHRKAKQADTIALENSPRFARATGVSSGDLYVVPMGETPEFILRNGTEGKTRFRSRSSKQVFCRVRTHSINLLTTMRSRPGGLEISGEERRMLRVIPNFCNGLRERR